MIGYIRKIKRVSYSDWQEDITERVEAIEMKFDTVIDVLNELSLKVNNLERGEK